MMYNNIYVFLQLVRLMELLEVNMITELRKKLAKELSLTIAERVREESVNATDLWKKPVSKRLNDL